MVRNEKGEVILDRSEYGLLIENDDRYYEPDPNKWSPEKRRQIRQFIEKHKHVKNRQA